VSQKNTCIEMRHELLVYLVVSDTGFSICPALYLNWGALYYSKWAVIW